MSPLAEGLFSKAIAQSGTNLAPWAQPAHKGVPQKRATYLAKKFDCYHANNWKKSLNCLRKVPAENITATFYDFFVRFTHFLSFCEFIVQLFHQMLGMGHGSNDSVPSCG